MAFVSVEFAGWLKLNIPETATNADHEWRWSRHAFLQGKNKPQAC